MSGALDAFSDFDVSSIISSAPDLGSIVTDLGTEFMDVSSFTSFEVPSFDVSSLGGFAQVGSFAGDASWFDTFNSGSILSSIPSVSDFSLPSLPSLPSLSSLNTGSLVSSAASAFGVSPSITSTVTKTLSNPTVISTAASAFGISPTTVATATNLLTNSNPVTTAASSLGISPTITNAAIKTVGAAPTVDQYGLNILTDAQTAAMEQKLTLVNSLVPTSSGSTNYDNAVATRDALLPLTRQFENQVNSATDTINQTTDTIARAQAQLADPNITDAERAVVEANIKDAYDTQAVAQEALTAAKTNLDATSTELDKALTVIESTNITTTNSPAPVPGVSTTGSTTVVTNPGDQTGTNARALVEQARTQQSIRDLRQNKAQSSDWRVRLRLAPNSTYLYNDPNPGILAPLSAKDGTDGVIFPYTPAIETAYKANYNPYDLTHSNYRGYFYQNSYVDAVNVRGVFTAQDTEEANYLLAVIHFFRSATKMFYGQDAQRGSPPPLVYLTGLGDYQFQEHACVISQFNYTLPPDVDYIRAGSAIDDGTNFLANRTRTTISGNPLSFAINRLLNNALTKGAESNPLTVGNLPVGTPTYVPTKMEIAISLLPIQSRQQVSTQFSVKSFANGNLLKGGFW